MPSFNRRSVLAALASTAAAPLVGTATASAATGQATAGQAATGQAAAAGQAATGVEFAQNRIPGMIAFGEPTWFPDAVREPLTVQVLPGTPARTQVSDSRGVLAVLTTGAKTVTVRGPRRTFTEQKRPFVDAFARTFTGDWGMSPGGGTWTTANGAPANYYVEPGRGVILLSQNNSSYFTTLNDPNIADFSATALVSLEAVPAGADTSVSLTFAYQGYDNHYRARLAVTSAGLVRLSVEKEQADVVSTLAAAVQVGTGYAANQRWRIRVERTGITLRARAWRSDLAEPSTWTHVLDDATFGAGKLGIRAIASKNSTAVPSRVYVHEFAGSGVWATPPVVTHDTWVRVLPTAYSGTWTPAVEQRVRAWPTDISPDALALAAMLSTGAAPYNSPAQGGAQVLGESGYGPLNPDGTRVEGADFHEYMGIPWTFQSGETRPAGTAEWLRTLDCSGMVRMVFGYHLGIPVVYDNPASFDGTTLPRRSRDIGPHGPGVIVHRDDTTAPPYPNLQIGDIVCFDADPDPTAELDHVGIYFGPDPAGHARFISSRKTVNGPTLSDLGGPSTLDGPGTYATSLRIIRRF
ncbi:hypothetical protein [Actinokineospora diospyrosa]|uniref:NlpC/P60 domain-containing protein n=1 Tax=Actinokineospora diospyrosa TaxID=103728 RepID=A0ABT1IPI1_9PSEU|nr:hypothetical protein [Actinokineospora diospyrosa]MCP2274371.1 hypothetical protein [Actinokineospora diospyrosa]